MVYNVGLWPAKTFEWRRVIQDLRKGGPLEMLTIAKLIKIKVQCTMASVFEFKVSFTLYVPFTPNFATKIYK